MHINLYYFSSSKVKLKVMLSAIMLAITNKISKPTVTYNTPKFVTIDTIEIVKNPGIKRPTAFIADSIAPILFVGTMPNTMD